MLAIRPPGRAASPACRASSRVRGSVIRRFGPVSRSSWRILGGAQATCALRLSGEPSTADHLSKPDGLIGHIGIQDRPHVSTNRCSTALAVDVCIRHPDTPPRGGGSIRTVTRSKAGCWGSVSGLCRFDTGCGLTCTGPEMGSPGRWWSALVPIVGTAAPARGTRSRRRTARAARSG
jgi:hypothetical protein